MTSSTASTGKLAFLTAAEKKTQFRFAIVIKYSIRFTFNSDGAELSSSQRSQRAIETTKRGTDSSSDVNLYQKHSMSVCVQDREGNTLIMYRILCPFHSSHVPNVLPSSTSMKRRTKLTTLSHVVI